MYALGEEVRGFCFVRICQLEGPSLCGCWIYFRPCRRLKELLRRSMGGIGGYRVNSHNVILLPYKNEWSNTVQVLETLSVSK